ncbi:RHS repeat-associated core domain-containing protein [Shewanella sp.]|uniref:RHS repeat domain-containing protein n=1 Tax=Shewanella sp. TaxID=50422 RepID=UPI0025DFB9B9|nr:RHS repeat-associated core domain-containing protein [Shewanella sp.]
MFIPIAVGDITIFIPIMPSSSSGSVTGTSTDGRYDLSWSAVSNASYYQIIITDENGTQRIIKVIGTHYSLAGLSLGSNKIEIQACNASNQCGVSYLAGTVSRSSKVRYQHTDMLGTPVMETDESGYVISRSVYEPFGKRLGGEKAGLGYTGHLQDEDLGLTYMQARYYDPLIGRFYSNDPVGFRDVHSFNRYAYGNNNPYRYTDPTGMASNDFIDAQNQIRDQGFGEKGVQAFNEGASDVAMEASGANDLIDAGSRLASGDISGAAVSVAMAVSKPLKIATKASKQQGMVKKGQTPKGIERFHSAEKSVPDSKEHVHFSDGTSLNVDGTVHDKKGGSPSPTNKQQKFLKSVNWPTKVE